MCNHGQPVGSYVRGDASIRAKHAQLSRDTLHGKGSDKKTDESQRASTQTNAARVSRHGDRGRGDGSRNSVGGRRHNDSGRSSRSSRSRGGGGGLVPGDSRVLGGDGVERAVGSSDDRSPGRNDKAGRGGRGRGS